MPDRNYESHFSKLPIMNRHRSKFKRNKVNSLTLNAGDIVPIYRADVLPGDTWKIDTDKFIRLTTPLQPTMDNLYLDTYFFYVPNRLVWDHWEQFCGASDKAWVDNIEYSIPKIYFDFLEVCTSFNNSGDLVSYPYINAGSNEFYLVQPMSLANYLGCPLGKLESVPTAASLSGLSSDEKNSLRHYYGVSQLPFRAYGLIYNWYFRDENLEDPIPLNIYSDADVDISGNLNGTFGWDHYLVSTDGSLGGNVPLTFNVYGSCLKAARFHDYFTSCLPNVQKGPDVLVPAGGYVSLLAPDEYKALHTPSLTTIGPSFREFNAGSWSNPKSGSLTSQAPNTGNTMNMPYSQIYDGTANVVYDPGKTLGFDNLMITINDLRMAAVMQQWEELNARAGSRYNEYLMAHYGVTNPDSRLQIPEYLGGDRFQLNMQDIPQTGTYGSQPLGSLAGKSVTFSTEHSVFKSFTEHGQILGLAVVRADNTYCQGIPKDLLRDNIFDYYDPLFANIGEQPVWSKQIYLPRTSGEIYSSGHLNPSIVNDDVFGYQEAWADYRADLNSVCGFLDPSSGALSLANYNYAQFYDSKPYLSKGWINQGVNELNRTLSVQSIGLSYLLNEDSEEEEFDIYCQFMAQFNFNVDVTREMPVYSIPGLKRL